MSSDQSSNDQSPTVMQRIGEEFVYQCLSRSSPLLDTFSRALPENENELQDFVKVLVVIKRCKPGSHNHEGPNQPIADLTVTDQNR